MRESEELGRIAPNRMTPERGPRMAGDFLSAIALLGMFAAYGVNFIACGGLAMLGLESTRLWASLALLLASCLGLYFFWLMNYFGELMAGKAYFREGDSPWVCFLMKPLGEVLLAQGFNFLLCGAIGVCLLGFWRSLPLIGGGLGFVVASYLLSKATSALRRRRR